MNEMMKNNMWFKTAFLTFVFCALGFVEIQKWNTGILRNQLQNLPI